MYNNTFKPYKICGDIREYDLPETMYIVIVYVTGQQSTLLDFYLKFYQGTVTKGRI